MNLDPSNYHRGSTWAMIWGGPGVPLDATSSDQHLWEGKGLGFLGWLPIDRSTSWEWLQFWSDSLHQSNCSVTHLHRWNKSQNLIFKDWDFAPQKSLVGGIPTPLNNISILVSWDDYSIPNGKSWSSHVPNHQPDHQDLRGFPKISTLLGRTPRAANNLSQPRSISGLMGCCHI